LLAFQSVAALTRIDHSHVAFEPEANSRLKRIPDVCFAESSLNAIGLPRLSEIMERKSIEKAKNNEAPSVLNVIGEFLAKGSFGAKSAPVIGKSAIHESGNMRNYRHQTEKRTWSLHIP
jgi:hypothetical protein